MKVLKYRYSGEKSQNFWTVVNDLPDECDRREVYALGVALQNLEEQVLRALEHANKGSVKQRNI